jgi:hypothetical protein
VTTSKPQGADPKSAGIDQIRVLLTDVLFDQIHPSTRVLLPNTDFGTIEDVVLTINGGRNPYVTVAGVPFLCPQSVAVAIIGQRNTAPYYLDITAALLAELRHLLDAVDSQAAMSAYKVGMDEWLGFVESYLVSMYGQDKLDHDKQLAAKLASSQKPSDLLKSLGDRSSYGLGGSLHIFNYLYKYISLPGVSLSKILTQAKVPISQFSTFGIECKHPVPGSEIAQVAGACRVTLQEIIHNPLREQLADLQTTISASLTEIDARLQIDGDIMQALSNAQDQLIALKKVTDGLEDHLTSGLAEIQQLKAAVTNVSAKIDGLK